MLMDRLGFVSNLGFDPFFKIFGSAYSVFASGSKLLVRPVHDVLRAYPARVVA
jgi:hypothetical protein